MESTATLLLRRIALDMNGMDFKNYFFALAADALLWMSFTFCLATIF